MPHRPTLGLFLLLCMQGVSCAGGQKGLRDVRTALMYQCFRIYDELVDPFGPEFFIECVLCKWFFFRVVSSAWRTSSRCCPRRTRCAASCGSLCRKQEIKLMLFNLASWIKQSNRSIFSAGSRRLQNVGLSWLGAQFLFTIAGFQFLTQY